MQFALATAHEAGRIGERDDSNRYADKVTTPAAVIQADDEEQGEDGPVREAPFGMPEAPAPIQREPNAVWDSTQTDTSGAVDWYVDVNFPPIILKDIDKTTTALKELYAVLPGNNIESQKLVVSMFLTMLGVNDVDEVMPRLFPPDLYQRRAPGMEPPLQPEDMARKIAAELGLRQPAQPTVPPNPPKEDEQVQEAMTTLARARVLRLVRAVERHDEAAAS